MNPYYNLPPEQRLTQRLLDQFNTDERLWKKLAPRRRARRKLLKKFLPPNVLKEFGLLEFARERPLECVGPWIEK